MFKKKKPVEGIAPPPIASENPNAVEVLRVWAAPGAAQQVSLQPTWSDPGAWGLVLADIAKHAANAYASAGQDGNEAFARICATLGAELQAPTDESRDITDE